MTPEQIQKRLTGLSAQIESIRAQLATKDQQYTPQPGEVVEVTSDVRLPWEKRVFLKVSKYGQFKVVNNGLDGQDVTNYRNGNNYKTATWQFCRRLNGEIIEFGCDKPKAPDYSHLLPEDYEFCTEEQAEKWVKVEMRPEISSINQGFLGIVLTIINKDLKPYFRPIRQIKYHVQVHEAVTAEPNIYAVDWSKAPEWADSHAWDEDGKGYWHGCIIETKTESWITIFDASFIPFPTGGDWRQSKTRRATV